MVCGPSYFYLSKYNTLRILQNCKIGHTLWMYIGHGLPKVTVHPPGIYYIGIFLCFGMYWTGKKMLTLNIFKCTPHLSSISNGTIFLYNNSGNFGGWGSIKCFSAAPGRPIVMQLPLQKPQDIKLSCPRNQIALAVPWAEKISSKHEKCVKTSICGVFEKHDLHL